MSIDTIGNFLTIIRNGVHGSKPFVLANHSKMNAEIAKILVEAGYVRRVEVVDSEVSAYKQLKIVLKYVEGESVIHELKRVSKPSRRVYTKVKNFKPVIGGLGISILTSSKGLVTDKQAKQHGIYVGGEVLCTVW